MFEHVTVAGGGLMGTGIAEVCARAGREVAVYDLDERAIEAGRARLTSSLHRAVTAGKIDQTEADRTTARVRFTTDLADLTASQLVIEAVTEHEPTKVALFAELDRVVRSDDAVFASNTSSIPIMKLAMATSRPGRVVGLHFFNPVPVLPLVEVVPSLLTHDHTVEDATRFATDVLGKHVIRSQDRAGFIVNALLIPYLLSAIRMLESGFATAEDIDSGMVRGAAHPMGPLALADLIGLDTTAAVAESLYAEFKEPLYAPPPLLARMVDAGLLGRKTGRGFFTYDRRAA